jgi:antitoxin (DNA-binding transcriptional repressor) of toxin-antitoxin stability system
VKAGETIEVTERGRPVAILGPVPVSAWDAMVSSGEVEPATRALDDLRPPADSGADLSGVLHTMRDEDRR